MAPYILCFVSLPSPEKPSQAVPQLNRITVTCQKSKGEIDIIDAPLDGVDDLVVGVGLGQLDPLCVVAAHQEAVGQRAQQVLQQRRRHEHAALAQVNLIKMYKN